jgi:hypothetical protein
MIAPVTASERDLRALATIVSQDRPDLPADGGLPESLLADLMSQIRCDAVVFNGFDSGREAHWFVQEVPSTLGSEDLDRAYWQHYRDNQFDSYWATPGILEAIKLGHPGNLGGHETWEDARSWRHRKSTRMSCANAR